MPTPQLAPDTERAIAKLNELWHSVTRYLDPDDLRLRQLAKLGRDLLRSHAAGGWTVLSSVAALSGDVRSAIENADKALRLSNQMAIVTGKSGALGNLGFFSEAGRTFRQILSVQTLPSQFIGEKSIASGSILALSEALKEAGNMPNAVPERLRRSTVLAAAILSQNGITDEDVGVWFDVAGAIMRENRMFFIGYPDLFATKAEEFDQVNVSFAIDVDPTSAAEFNEVLVERCFAAGVETPECFSFSFRSIPSLNERRAA